ncbi:MAG: hypothetical protein AVDCRST_MAG68-3184 [uncultured Gemmatimonadetes bacterium]|uniref:Uncharacterized protein n=1 Tax=uncultured Gemmatimonadota bacterium TaxID=203437 RepID=A0A6J4LWE1_9BACT|nr:MAG: hypothetical protein AVDCRST_MAG68-3184 [uncultured Gemmatimonadota bacterium]
MKLRFLVPVALVLGACTPPAAGPRPEGGTLRAFRSEREFSEFNRDLVRKRRDDPPPPPVVMPPPPAPQPVPAPMPGEPAAAPGLQGVVVGANAESVTNVQHAGVDEGGIVKTHGDHLVILRRGRVFTVRVGDGGLRPVAAVDAFGPGIDPAGAWYDELLVADTLVAVIGYSYRRGGTEVGLFRIDRDGGLAHRGTYQLRSGDYYSTRNYASRLVGGKLVFYAPIPIDPEEPFASFPAFRRWGAGDTTFQRTAAATRVYRPAGRLSADEELTLHTVTVCGLAGGGMSCQATALFGPEGREFYVSPRAVYVWTTQEPAWDAPDTELPRSVLYRMPLDGSAPSGVRVSGQPADQFSFLESGDAHLNVVVRGERPERRLSLLRLPIARFGDGSAWAPAAAYRPLPTPRQGGSLQNRFLGDWLLYGAGNGWGTPRDAGSRVYAVRWAGADSVAALDLPHAVDRIEAMGGGAVVVGSSARDLHFSGMRLGASATLADRYVRSGASQGETRSHGFFYRPDGEESGLLGLPIRGAGKAGAEQLEHGSASVLFLRNRAFRFAELGDLAARPATEDDGCRVSCVDWYGNARPLFLRGRIFALMGYELVEGAENDGRIRETRRVSFAPRR